MMTCSASGDPHYQVRLLHLVQSLDLPVSDNFIFKPFHYSNPKAKWTVMGEGEFTLVKRADFHLSACSQDVSVDRTSTRKLTWNRDFAVKQEYPVGSGEYVTVVVQGGATQDYVLTATKESGGVSTDLVAPVNLGVHANEGTWACDATAKGGQCKRMVKTDDVEIFLARRKRKGVWATKGHRLTIKFPSSGRVIQATIASKTNKAEKFGKRTLFNLLIKVPDDNTEPYDGFCSETKASIKTKGFLGFAANQISTCTTKDDVTDVEVKLVNDVVKEFVDPDTAAPCAANVTSAAVQHCTAVEPEDMMACILDQVSTKY
jgi:hypothetical protein